MTLTTLIVLAAVGYLAGASLTAGYTLHLSRGWDSSVDRQWCSALAGIFWIAALPLIVAGRGAAAVARRLNAREEHKLLPRATAVDAKALNTALSEQRQQIADLSASLNKLTKAGK